MEWGGWPAFVGAVLVITATLGGAVTVVLRSTKNEIIADQAAYIDQLKERLHRYEVEVAELRAQVQLLRSELVRDMAREVALAVLEAEGRRRAPRRAEDPDDTDWRGR